MPSSLGPIIGALTICSSLAMFWSAGGHKDARIYRLLAVAWLIGGLAWFVPSDTARALFWTAAAAVSMPTVVALMIRTWRQASIHE